MVQRDGATAFNSKIGARALSSLLVEPTSGRALSTFSQSDSERRANRTGFARESSARIELASWRRSYSLSTTIAVRILEMTDVLCTRGGDGGNSCSARPVLSRAGRYFRGLAALRPRRRRRQGWCSKPAFFASVCENDTCGWRGVWRSRKGWLGHALDLNGDHLTTRQSGVLKTRRKHAETRLRTPQPRNTYTVTR